MRIILLALSVLTLFAMIEPASAEITYPWCAQKTWLIRAPRFISGPSGLRAGPRRIAAGPEHHSE